MSISVKLPLHETAKVSSIKLPIRETALILNGFVMHENIIEWLKKDITLIESVKSRLLLNAELLDKNHVKLQWFGENVPKVMIFDTLDGEDMPATPFVTVPWTPQEYTMLIDANGHDIMIKGTGDTGESNILSIGENKEYNVACAVELPLNEKNYFIDIDLVSEYRIGVNF